MTRPRPRGEEIKFLQRGKVTGLNCGCCCWQLARCHCCCCCCGCRRCRGKVSATSSISDLLNHTEVGNGKGDLMCWVRGGGGCRRRGQTLPFLAEGRDGRCRFEGGLLLLLLLLLRLWQWPVVQLTAVKWLWAVGRNGKFLPVKKKKRAVESSHVKVGAEGPSVRRTLSIQFVGLRLELAEGPSWRRILRQL